MSSRRTCVCSQCGQEGHNSRNRQCLVNVQARENADATTTVTATTTAIAEARRHALFCHTEASRLTAELRDIVRSWEYRLIGTRRLTRDVPEIIHLVCFYASSADTQGINIDSFFTEFKDLVIAVNQIIHRYGGGRTNFVIQRNANGEIKVVNVVRIPRTVPVQQAVSTIKRTVAYLKEVALLDTLTFPEPEAEPETEDISCPLCFDTMCPQETVVTNCTHTYCVECIKGYTTSIKDKTIKPCCPMCRTEITQFKMKKPEIYQAISEHLSTL